ncbi:hypothetical protein ABH923_003895 [Leifsonia sp. EB41]|uniref:hypothetical protein n=1 Tax=Leifsonia sp. EB41 TaxID=3156260 RepID=UPI0035132B3F
MTAALVHASCATPPPNGQPCNDTVAYGPIPDVVWLSVAGILVALVVAVVVWRRWRRR